ncbi:MAG: signal recognition particle protein [Spirochaetales bacterium]|jgi:signal recognition particle subunit SRP54|nr:signal recognition particle protein [Spirochaetales bacterium]
MFDKLTNTFSDIVRQLSGKAKISDKNIEETVEQIKMALLEADVNLRVVRRFVNRTAEEARGEKILTGIAPGQQFIKIIHDRMVDLLGDEKQDLVLKGPDTQTVILFCGLQGSGKTTTAAKLALRLKKNGRRPLLVAADLVRPAAVEQLAVLGRQTETEVWREEGAKNPVSVVRNALAHAGKFQFDTVIVDTSGRQQIDEDLMNELLKIKEAARPDEVLLVADAMTGQNAVDIAKAFEEKIGLTGVILSKFDSDTRGGAALSIKSICGKPIKFAGTGEKIEDLEPFYPERIASRILGMGDIVSLVEKAQQTINQQEAEALQLKMESSTFTLADFLDQFKRMRKMGSLKSLLEMVPGLSGQLREEDINENEMKHQEAIILSMTPVERDNYRIIGPTRRKRIARGSGTSVFAVNQLLKRFEKARLMMKKAAKNKGGVLPGMPG